MPSTSARKPSNQENFRRAGSDRQFVKESIGLNKNGLFMLNLKAFRSLVLNSSYQPMRVVNWQKALILWLQGKVEILEYHSVVVRSARMQFQLPSVLRLKSYVKSRALGPVRFSRENVYLRDDYTCQYCQKEFPPSQLTLDHVVPASKNGKKTWSNVVTACRKCNQRKANRTPDGASMPLLKVPKPPLWLPAVPFEMRNNAIPPSWLQYLRAGSKAS